MRIQINICLCLFVLVFPITVLSSEDAGNLNEMARAEWVKGFQKLEEAEHSEEFGNYENALDLLNEAKTIFQRVKTIYKQWNQSLLNFRIRYCEQKIRKLEGLNTLGTQKTQIKEFEKPAESQISKGNKNFGRDNEDLESEVSVLGDKLAILAKARKEAKPFPFHADPEPAIDEQEIEKLRQTQKQLEAENQSLENQVHDLTSQIRGLKTKQQNGEAQEQLNEQLSAQSKKLKQLTSEINEKRERVSEIKQEKETENKKLEKQLEETRSELAAANESNLKLSENATNLQEAELDKNQLQTAKQELETKVQDLTNQIKSLTSQKQDQGTEFEQRNEQLRQLNAKLTDQSKQLEELKNELRTQIERVSEIEVEKKAEVQKLKKQLEGMRSKLATANESSQKLSESATKLQEAELGKDQLQTAKHELETKVQDLTNQIKSLTSQKQDQGTGVEQQNEQLRQLNAKFTDQTKQLEELKNELIAKKERIVNLEQGKQTMDTELRQQLEETRLKLATSNDSNQKLTEQIEDITEQIEIINAEKEESQSKQHEEVGEVIKLQRLLEAQRERKEEYKVELDGNQFEIKNIRKIKRELETNFAELKTKYAQKDKEARETEKELQKYNEEIEKWHAALKAEEVKVAKLQKEINKVRSDLEIAQGANGRHKEKIEELKTELERKNNKVENLQVEVNSQDDKLVVLGQSYDEVRKSEAKLNEKYNTNLALLNSLKSEIEQLKKQLNTNPNNQSGIDGLTTQLYLTNDSRKKALRISKVNDRGDSDQGEKFDDFGSNMSELNKELLAKDATITEKQKLIDELHQKISKLNDSGTTANAPTGKKSAGKSLSSTQNPLSISTSNLNEEFNTVEQINGLLMKASMAKRLGNLKESISIYRDVLEIRPNEMTALVELGKLSIEYDNHKDAEQYLTKAFYQNSNDPEALSLLGYTLIELDKTVIATSLLNQAITIHPENAVLRRYYGIALLNIGKKGSAETELKRSFSLDDTSANTAYKLAVLYAGMTPPRISDAKEWYTKAKGLGVHADSNLEDLLRD